MRIRIGNINDLNELQQLFVETVKCVCKADYNDVQLDIWTSGIENKQRWQDILTNQFVVVAQNKDKITGFCTLNKGNHLDLLYVHRDFQRQGIALKLYLDIEKEARLQGQNELTSDVSKTARPFFEKMGFEIITEQTVDVKEIKLTNFKMSKKIV